ncbi:TetR family transcriptional regulator [Mycobacterium szulgai]|uniref:TetR family transcriptional regulator n=2 Tax=Mycobacterium szulgai TaxID=1787 RepID=A0A1X2FC51_MYCSZ|nr:TetR/AcrR family transcriptional regulator [Mycobacterium szulgai]MCV7077666.1 TetR/AcrR family transcriptional regulator [Mycobacterium szulgai]ORX16030.1 TetR family transcriptional regulator [Mycobacterium szulgai]
MSRSERKKANTASAILDAAEVLFRQRGFQATTIDEIAERADVSVGSVYVHFENKARLYLALVERALTINEAAMGKVAELNLSSPLERVFAAGDAYLNFHLEHPGAFQMIALRVLEASSGLHEVEARIADRVQQLVDAVEADLRAAIEAGEVRSDLDAARAMRFLWGAWNGVIGMTLREDRLRIDDQELRATLAVARSVVTDGLRAGGAQR